MKRLSLEAYTFLPRQSKEIVKAALKRVGMWSLRERQIGELSGGQQQRVFLARSLAQEAELFFFYEPFVGVDKKTEAIIFEVFEDLKSQGKILLVTQVASYKTDPPKPPMPWGA